MKQWPEIDNTPTKVDKLFNGASVLLVLGTALGMYVYWGIVPDQIPSHYGWNGQADAWGFSGGLYYLVGIMGVLTLSMVGVQRFPQWFNYPVPVTLENGQKQYRNAVRMVQVLNVIINLFFAYVIYKTMTVTPQSSGLHPGALQVFLIGMLGSVGYFIRKGYTI